MEPRTPRAAQAQAQAVAETDAMDLGITVVPRECNSWASDVRSHLVAGGALRVFLADKTVVWSGRDVWPRVQAAADADPNVWITLMPTKRT